jgi:polyisoprenoid-binding protein YceI
VYATRPQLEESVRYVIDTQTSKFVVQAFATGLLSAFAHSPKIAIRDFEGDLSFVPSASALENTCLQIRVRADSLEVIDDISEKDRAEIQSRMRDEVLQAEGFPEIVYDCSRITASGSGPSYWAALAGDLTLRGVTQPQPISARVTLSGDSLRASGELTLRQSAYGIEPVTAVGGTIRLKDELKFTFDISARKQG